MRKIILLIFCFVFSYCQAGKNYNQSVLETQLQNFVQELSEQDQERVFYFLENKQVFESLTKNKNVINKAFVVEREIQLVQWFTIFVVALIGCGFCTCGAIASCIINKNRRGNSSGQQVELESQ